MDLAFRAREQVSQPAAPAQPEKPAISKWPYPEFTGHFREMVDPYFIDSSQSYLHLVFGNISDIRHMSIVVGSNQDFDLYQSSPNGVMGALWNLKTNGRSILDEVNAVWKISDRPKDAGLGTSHFVRLPENDHHLEGLLFAVTTRDLSEDESQKGRYINTPVQGIPIVLGKVFAEARARQIEALALPLLGAGYANIARTHNNPELRLAFEKAILAISIDESLIQLTAIGSCLHRIVIVVFSDAPQSPREHALWELAIKMLNPYPERRMKLVDELVAAIG